MITIIVATDRNNGIGYNNGLLAHIPGDLRRFRDITMGHCLIMGKRTWESLPRRPLPGRVNIVLTDNELDCFDCALTARSLEESLQMCEPGKEIFIIGGGSVYHQFMPLADRLLITRMDAAFVADTFFPEVSPEEWVLTAEEHHGDDAADGFSYSYRTYMRRKVEGNRQENDQAPEQSVVPEQYGREQQ